MDKIKFTLFYCPEVSPFLNNGWMPKSRTMTHIFHNNFYKPFPSLYPQCQTCNSSFETLKPYSYFINSPLHENVIVYILSWRAMKVRMANPLCSIAKWMRELLRFISLLFGICSSQTCYIRDAFCGTSLYRFPLFHTKLLCPFFSRDGIKNSPNFICEGKKRINNFTF